MYLNDDGIRLVFDVVSVYVRSPRNALAEKQSYIVEMIFSSKSQCIVYLLIYFIISCFIFVFLWFFFFSFSFSYLHLRRGDYKKFGTTARFNVPSARQS